MERNTVAVFDFVDMDNGVAVVAAARLPLNLRAVIVTGRLAHPDRTVDIAFSDLDYSRQVLALNARRMKGLLWQIGIDVPVFAGLIPPATIVPHRIHINEFEKFDPDGRFDDVRVDGDFRAACDFIGRLDGPIDLIVGGPLTEVWELMHDQWIGPKLDTITCQLGLFGFGDVATMAGGGVTFNMGCDREAAVGVIEHFRGSLFMVPTDITKLPSVGFDDPDALRAIGMFEPLVQPYEVFYEGALRGRGERIYPHDVHATFLMAQLRGMVQPIYEWQGITIQQVGEKGEIERFTLESTPFNRSVVTSVDAEMFHELLRQTVCES